MNDWAAFAKAVPWFVCRDAVVDVSNPRRGWALSQAAASMFAFLGKLLAEASVTSVSVNGIHYELVVWDSIDGDRMGWLCLPPTESPPRNIFNKHRDLLASFGGIVERFNEPEDTWLLNLNDALTEREAANDARFIHNYSWAFDDAGLTLPIEPAECYSIAREANGNTTLCHRISGKVLMFALDHCFKHLKVLDGCPEYSLYTINGAATFRDWVNAVAQQWLAHTDIPA